MTTDVGASLRSARDDVPRDPPGDVSEDRAPTAGRGVEMSVRAAPEAGVATWEIWGRVGMGVTVALLGLCCAVSWIALRPVAAVEAPHPTATPFTSATAPPSLPIPLATSAAPTPSASTTGTSRSGTTTAPGPTPVPAARPPTVPPATPTPWKGGA
jgi:hypothetical protein